MPQFPVSDEQGILDGLNYVLSGPGSLGQQIQGVSSKLNTLQTGDIIDPTSGEIVNSLPYTTVFLQPYLTDLQTRIGVNGGTDRVLISAQLNNTFTYSATADCELQYTVKINRYRAAANRSTNYNDYLFFYSDTVSEQQFTLGLPTTTGGLIAVSASGVKPAFTEPASGSLILPVNETLVGVNATTGTGLDAIIQLRMAYGAAGSYNDVNTQIEVIAPGNNWTIGDTIVIPGSSFPGGATPTNDLTLTVTEVSNATGANIDKETLFLNVIDEPPLGYYLYAVEIEWFALVGSVDITESTLGVRSISTQLLKQ